MYTAKKLTYHLYLENVEVDFSSIQIIEQVDAPPQAIVGIIPVTGIYNVLPKTIAVITCEIEKRDPKTGAAIYDEQRGERTKVYEELVIFVGELNGYGLNRAPDSAQVQLSFNGFTQNWETSPVIPVHASIPTMAESLLLGVNYFQDSVVDETGVGSRAQFKSHGFLYSQFPSVLLSLAELLPRYDSVTKTIIEPKIPEFLTTIDVTYDRKEMRTALSEYIDKEINARSQAYKDAKSVEKTVTANRIRSLQKPFTYFLKHFLLNYGMFLQSLTKSLLLDAMVSYIGSAKAEQTVATLGTITHLKEGLKNSSNSTTVMEVLNRVFPALRYNLIEYPAPIKTRDSLGDTLTLAKILIKPRSELFAPLANNVIFDDNIVTAQYSRNLLQEPTRLMSLTTPTLTTDSKNLPLLQYAMATVVPHNILMKDALRTMAINTKKDIKDYETKAEKASGMQGIDISGDLEAQLNNLDLEKALKTDEDKQYFQLLKTLADDRESKKDAKLGKPGPTVFGMTSEEFLRGVVMQIKPDENHLEQAYLLSLINKKVEAVDPTKAPFDDLASWQNDKTYNTTVATTVEVNDGLNSEDVQKTVVSYYAELSHYHYLESRRRPRSLSLLTDYSPYRVCGFAGLVILKDIGPVVGFLRGITTSINASGEAQQSLMFSHVSIINTLRALDTNVDFHDQYQDMLPSYLSEFRIAEVGKNLYNYVSGRSNASVFDYCKETKADVKNTRDCAEMLKQKYETTTTLEHREQFLHALIWRNMATLGEYMATIKHPTHEFKPRGVREVITYSTNPRPFVDIRQQAVIEIFKQVNPKIAVWKDPYAS
jgi:hypothetical protein